MKKIILLFFLIASCCIQKLSAQAPQEMAYQIMVLDPKTGKIQADEDVSIRIEIRKNAPNGSVVWEKDFNGHTDQTGVCSLTLDFSDKIDWSAESYYLATIINGTECGSPKITSVPYALHAASLEGIITQKELIGTWKYSGEEFTDVFTFKEDGTGLFQTSEDGITGYHGYPFKWMLNKAGFLAIQNTGSSSDKSYDKNSIWYTMKVADNQIFLASDGEGGYIYIKQ